MNKVELIGRLTKEPELKLTTNQTQFCNFTVAVDRKFKDANGQRQTDFINCVAWKQTAVFIQKYFHKGSKIALIGNIQTRSYDDQNGQKHFVTEVIIDEVEFVESQPTSQTASQPISQPQETLPAPAEPDEPASLPFEL